MPSGRTHAAITILASGGLFMTAYVFTGSLENSLALTGGCLVGVLLTPDLDVNEGAHSQRVVRKRAGCLPGALWGTLWYPYAKAIPHRHWLSHAPLIGTFLRVAYLGLPIWLLLALLGYSRLWLYLPGWWLWVWALIGLVFADFLHWFADTFSTRIKRSFGRLFR